MKYKNKSTRSGTERPRSISNLIETMGGAGGGGGKLGFKYKPSGKGATNISGPTQTSGIHPSVAKQAKTIDPVRFWLRNIPGAKITSFGVISAGSAAATKKKKQKKRVGRTILTEY